MQRVILVIMALVIMTTSCPLAQGAEPTTQQNVMLKKKPAKRNKMTSQQARSLQKKAEADGKRHQMEGQLRQYQMMQEAQRRGTQQQH